MDTGTEQRLNELHDKQAIENVVSRHNQGIDRGEQEVMADCYDEDGVSVFGAFFNGSGKEFARRLTGGSVEQPRTSGLHRTASTWVHLDGNRATSESYILALGGQQNAERPTQTMIGGRYLDEHERRDGAWRIKKRTYVLEWNVNLGSAATRSGPAIGFGEYAPFGTKVPDDAGRVLLAYARMGLKGGNNPEVGVVGEDAVEIALSKQSLRELSLAYARGVDRADAELLRQLFTDDARIEVGWVNDTGANFPDRICEFVRTKLKRPFHSISNDAFKIDGDRASGECYVIAASTVTDDEGASDVIVGGRFLDQFVRAGGVWKFSERKLVIDWNRTGPATGVYDSGMYKDLNLRGGFKPNDPIYGAA